MSEFDLDRIGGPKGLDALLDEVLACGEMALAYQREGTGASKKPDSSPVTEADRAVEARLRTHLMARYPGAGFFGEETGEQRAQDDLRFVVDPIDGTRAFIRGLPSWSILIGLEAQGEPVVGVALMPARGDLFVAVKGQGAHMNGRPLRVSKVERLADSLISHGALSQFADHGTLPLLPASTYTQRGFADFEGYRQLLLGQADAVVDPDIKAYDVAPAAVLVREAGGRFSDFTGAETIHGGSALASNGLVHDELLALCGDD
ncbi:MAG: histidinol phosphate phosphatase [Deltaproteobacteria bacterium]|nr:histidinol phosphate phosphatase [Deltaproteobacteria bacterium]